MQFVTHMHASRQILFFMDCISRTPLKIKGDGKEENRNRKEEEEGEKGNETHQKLVTCTLTQSYALSTLFCACMKSDMEEVTYT